MFKFLFRERACFLTYVILMLIKTFKRGKNIELKISFHFYKLNCLFLKNVHILTLFYIMLKSGQTYFKNLAMFRFLAIFQHCERKRQHHKIVKHTRTIRRHFAGLAFNKWRGKSPSKSIKPLASTKKHLGRVTITTFTKFSPDLVCAYKLLLTL